MNISRNRAIALAILAIFAEKIYTAFAYGADGSLYPLPGKEVVPGSGNIPYSLMWTWINPLWLGHFWYGMYILAFDAMVTFLMWYSKRIPKMYIFAWQLMTVTFYAVPGAEYQNVSIFATYPLMFISPWFAVLPILLKLPFPWLLYDWANPHVVCALACSGINDGSHTLLVRLQAYATTYAVLGVGWAWTFWKARKYRRIWKARQ